MNMSKVFNWLATETKRQYTLATLNKDICAFGFTRAGRITERLITGAGVLSAAFGVATSPVALPGTLLVGGLYLYAAKITGVTVGSMVDVAIRSISQQPNI